MKITSKSLRFCKFPVENWIKKLFFQCLMFDINFQCQSHQISFFIFYFPPGPQRDLSVATDISVRSQRETSVATGVISLWPQIERDLSVARDRKRSLCGYRKVRDISLWLQNDQRYLSVATRKSRCSHREISLWPQKEFSVATQISAAAKRSLWPQRDVSGDRGISLKIWLSDFFFAPGGHQKLKKMKK